MKNAFIILAVFVGLSFAVFAGNELAEQTHIIPSPQEPLVGSVAKGSEYSSTSTLNGTAAGLYRLTPSSATGTPMVLGSVIITSSSGSIFTILDGDGIVTTTVALFKASAAEGTYTFDLNTYKGLTIQVPASFNGHFVTTFR